eukprot:741251-Alexandrium_andersonii.AAC.1
MPRQTVFRRWGPRARACCTSPAKSPRRSVMRRETADPKQRHPKPGVGSCLLYTSPSPRD